MKDALLSETMTKQIRKKMETLEIHLLTKEEEHYENPSMYSEERDSFDITSENVEHSQNYSFFFEKLRRLEK